MRIGCGYYVCSGCGMWVYLGGTHLCTGGGYYYNPTHQPTIDINKSEKDCTCGKRFPAFYDYCPYCGKRYGKIHKCKTGIAKEMEQAFHPEYKYCPRCGEKL